MSTTWTMPSPKPFSGLSNHMGPITNIEELFQHYREIVVLDTEYISNPGERPVPVCAVAYELRSGRKHKF